MLEIYGNNLAFLTFLNLVRKDPSLREALEKKDFSSINGFPGLSEEDRTFLKLCNWKQMEIDVTDEDIDNFKPGLISANDTVCERKVASEAAEMKCYKV